MPVKERSLKLYLMLLLMGDLDFGFVKMTPAMQQIFDLSLNQKTKGTLSSLIKEGKISKNPDEDTSYCLTSKGFEALCLEFPFFRFQKYTWDGLWRILSYEIPESKRFIRDSFRRSIQGWGLGPWHRSFWVSPHPVLSTLRDMTYAKEEEQYIQAFEATHMVGKLDVLVEKVWKLSNLEKEYKQLFKRWHELLSEELDPTSKLSHVVYAYITQLRKDPGLPASLVGRQWIGFEAYTIFKDIRNLLAKSLAE
jgi:phenylacetic acid degradation operon negative regulatory protein